MKDPHRETIWVTRVLNGKVLSRDLERRMVHYRVDGSGFVRVDDKRIDVVRSTLDHDSIILNYEGKLV